MKLQIQQDGPRVLVNDEEMDPDEAVQYGHILVGVGMRALNAKRLLAIEQQQNRSWPDGYSHVVVVRDGGMACRLARDANGLPVRVLWRLGRWREFPADCLSQVRDGPPLQAKVVGGRKWRELDDPELQHNRRIRAWRLKPGDP